MKTWFFLLTCCMVCASARAQHSEIISSHGSKLHYRIFGKGLPLLIINGGPGMNSDGFAGLAEALASNARQVIIYDQRGTGKSVVPAPDSTSITMDLMVADIETLRQHLRFGTWDILGHSFGGMLASYYATKHPDRIRSLVLSSSGGIDLGLLSYAGEMINNRLSAEQRQNLALWSRRINEGDTSANARWQRALALAPAYVYYDSNVAPIAGRLTQGNSRLNSLVWQDMQRIQFDCAEGLRKTHFPVLIIQGREDIVKAETAERAQKAFPDARLVFMEHCVHYGWLDNREKYFSEVNRFLAARP